MYLSPVYVQKTCAHVTLSWPCQTRTEALVLQVREDRSHRSVSRGAELVPWLCHWLGSLGEPSAFVWPPQVAGLSHQPIEESASFSPASLLLCDPGKLSHLSVLLCALRGAEIPVGAPARTAVWWGRAGSGQQTLSPLPSIAGSPGFPEPTWPGSTMRRMAVRPTAFSGGS